MPLGLWPIIAVMRIQLLSDLHLESESFDPTPAPQAEVLVLAGDIDSSWAGLERFAGWPTPVLFVPGNHEFDRRDIDDARQGLRDRCAALGLICLDRDEIVRIDDRGRHIRFLGTVRWSDFEVFGPEQRDRSMRAASYFQKVQQSTWRNGQPFDATAVRELGLGDRAWLSAALVDPARPQMPTVVITHFAPSLRSHDPRFGLQPGTASFCNGDDDLIPRCDLWLHGHLHCRLDYLAPRPDRPATRVICNARGLKRREEDVGFDPGRIIEI
jgi:hypothetical protein